MAHDKYLVTVDQKTGATVKIEQVGADGELTEVALASQGAPTSGQGIALGPQALVINITMGAAGVAGQPAVSAATVPMGTQQEVPVSAQQQQPVMLPIGNYGNYSPQQPPVILPISNYGYGPQQPPVTLPIGNYGNYGPQQPPVILPIGNRGPQQQDEPEPKDD